MKLNGLSDLGIHVQQQLETLSFEVGAELQAFLVGVRHEKLTPQIAASVSRTLVKLAEVQGGVHQLLATDTLTFNDLLVAIQELSG